MKKLLMITLLLWQSVAFAQFVIPRDINFTMDLVMKDISLFQDVADKAGAKLELSPLLIEIFKDGIERFGEREWSPNIIKRLEEACGCEVLASGFPAEIVDDEEPAYGVEITPKRG